MGDAPIYQAFLGTWILDPTSCRYEQGEPPQAGVYRIEQAGDALHFHVEWTAADGTRHEVEFSGVPDGRREPFAGGDLADALSVHAVSPRELTSSAYYRGTERMVAQRQLDDSGNAMRVVQLVRLPDGTSPANVAVYLRQVRN
ncbi:MAG TPA: hypothetical protein VKZ63_00370 [Kofleriaceae bacterium]|nr:hypothetical protein [Kofleriaceae bacterium]